MKWKRFVWAGENKTVVCVGSYANIDYSVTKLNFVSSAFLNICWWSKNNLSRARKNKTIICFGFYKKVWEWSCSKVHVTKNSEIAIGVLYTDKLLSEWNDQDKFLCELYNVWPVTTAFELVRSQDLFLCDISGTQSTNFCRTIQVYQISFKVNVSTCESNSCVRVIQRHSFANWMLI